MHHPDGTPPGFHLDKCQGCGAWTPEEEAALGEYLKKFNLSASARAPGGCNCTGKR